MAKNVTVYTTNTCASCSMLKRYLASKGQEYDLINLDEQPDELQKVIDMTGQMAVPVTVVKDVEDERAQPHVVVGWQPGLIASALGA
ncbi:glutaredoxin [candidate division TM7 genomosp. GTL1]|nr:glutaredoxin [candidate division TM7 genomosp. GTL1]